MRKSVAAFVGGRESETLEVESKLKMKREDLKLNVAFEEVDGMDTFMEGMGKNLDVVLRALLDTDELDSIEGQERKFTLVMEK